MRPRIKLLVTAAATVLSLFPTTAKAADPGPPLTESPDALTKTLSCPASFKGAHEPVLLVHATTETGTRNWATNYGRVLPTMGYDVCTVELVDEATGDIQLSAERTVYAIRTIHQRTGQRVQVVGHSQGPLEVRWAIKYWPDIKLMVDDLIGIAAPYHGWRQTDIYCSSACVAALWQMRMESKFMGALNAGDETPGDVSYTSVYTLNDELVQPYSTADLAGGTNVTVQDVCPGRVVEHIEMVFDAATYGLVLDALAHPGPADKSRFDKGLCLQRTMPGVTPADLMAGEVDFWSHCPPKLGENQLKSEPPLASYAS
ncbi:MAG TPA: lipase [Acidimicrobiia bacterium]|jgi:triacylglycerol esterase/lipase EstA (alpha/beta hydrolase family)|nr:lipase [Acidimicrobiia bacterium]